MWFRRIASIPTVRRCSNFCRCRTSAIDNWRVEDEVIPEDVLASISRKGVGYNAPELFPSSNERGLLPNVTFGGIPNAANITLTNTPLAARYLTYSVTDNITRTFSGHTLKAGIFLI